MLLLTPSYINVYLNIKCPLIVFHWCIVLRKAVLWFPAPTAKYCRNTLLLLLLLQECMRKCNSNNDIKVHWFPRTVCSVCLFVHVLLWWTGIPGVVHVAICGLCILGNTCKRPKVAGVIIVFIDWNCAVVLLYRLLCKNELWERCTDRVWAVPGKHVLWRT